MKCLVHDYAGHPFQVELSRHLVQRGHDVTHVYFADNPGPKGQFGRNEPSLYFVGVTFGTANDAAGTGRISLGRRKTDLAYAQKVADLIDTMRPDVVISGNTPTEAQRIILRACKRMDIRFVYWVQDVYSMAVTKLLSKRLGLAGKAIGLYYQVLDRRQFRQSDQIVVISDDFVPLVSAWAGPEAKIAVIENWAAIGDLPVKAKQNAWSRENHLSDQFTYLYSGTLGRKHNPNLLIALARACGHRDAVVVVGQGHGVPILKTARNDQCLDTLRLLPIQPAERLADVLATADVLIATIEPDAGTFAVPSKVLSYLCAGRPILLAAPKDNLAARIVQRAKGGIVIEAGDDTGFLAAAQRLRQDKDLRAQLGANGRAYAERTFDMQHITDKFERVLQ